MALTVTSFGRSITCMLLMASTAGHATGESPSTFPQVLTQQWCNHPIWHDGKAEFCLYDSTRRIYGAERHYQAKLYTNKEVADPQTKTKSATASGREVFKHHLVEVVPTANYEYKFSTMCYVGAEDMKSLKIDMGSQDDCGASFKQFINHVGTVTWHSHVYFPGAGHEHGAYESPSNFVYQDALSLVLRGYPFEAPLPPVEVNLLPDQTSARKTPPTPTRARVFYVKPETLTVPAGHIDTHHLRVTTDPHAGHPVVQHDYWFAASGDMDRLHVMVQHVGPQGQRHVLREQRRWAYWER